MESFLDSIGGPEAVEDRDIQAQLDLPTSRQWKCISVAAVITASIVGVKYNVRQVAAPSRRDRLVLGSSLRLEALQLRTGNICNFSRLVERVRDRCHGRIFDQRPLGQLSDSNGVLERDPGNLRRVLRGDKVRLRAVQIGFGPYDVDPRSGADVEKTLGLVYQQLPVFYGILIYCHDRLRLKIGIVCLFHAYNDGVHSGFVVVTRGAQGLPRRLYVPFAFAEIVERHVHRGLTEKSIKRCVRDTCGVAHFGARPVLIVHGNRGVVSCHLLSQDRLLRCDSFPRGLKARMIIQGRQ